MGLHCWWLVLCLASHPVWCSLSKSPFGLSWMRLPAPAPRCAAPPAPCRDAKLSVLHWDAGAHALAPSSLHYFEGDASLKAGRTQFPYPPLAVSGARRAAAPPGGSRLLGLVLLRESVAWTAAMPMVDAALLP